MVEEQFIFTGKDLIKLALMVVVAAFFFGVPGVLMVLFFHWITRSSFAADTIEKHGISDIKASRLGGVAIFISSFGLLGLVKFIGVIPSENQGSSNYLFFWVASLLCGLIGLIEDLQNGRLSASFRLKIKLIVCGLVVAIWPVLIPSDLGIPILDIMLSLPLLGWTMTVFFCVGFINAINMADGANGLVSGILTISFSIFFVETGNLLYAALMTSCSLFTMFNVISGRLFLGDTGTYGLGAALAVSGLFLHSQGVFSAAFLAVLFAYPCIDLLVSLFRRFWQGRSIFLPDNDHLHNRINFHCQKWFKSKVFANSITGVGVSLMFSGPALIGYLAQWSSATSDEWIWIFVVQCMVYLSIFWLSGVSRPASQYATSI